MREIYSKTRVYSFIGPHSCLWTSPTFTQRTRNQRVLLSLIIYAFNLHCFSFYLVTGLSVFFISSFSLLVHFITLSRNKVFLCFIFFLIVPRLLFSTSTTFLSYHNSQKPAPFTLLFLTLTLMHDALISFVPSQSDLICEQVSLL